MRALIDTDVILEVLLDRSPFSVDAKHLLDANKQGQFEGYIAAITLVNLFHIGRKVKGSDAVRQDIRLILTELQVCPVDQQVLQTALDLPFADYEDAVQHTSAISSNLDAIVTPNLKDYIGANLPVFSPGDFLKHLSIQP